ncbi:MAG: HAD family hydrolase [Halobacteriaceae archaeon]
MEWYDRLYGLYDEFDTETLRAYQEFVDLFPPVDSRVGLEYWDRASDDLARRRQEIREQFREGETLADVAAHATREQAFTALDLFSTYERAVNVFVLDVDETLRSAGGTDNEIPRETLHLLTEFLDDGVPIVVCTGQTLENVKGFMIQGLGNELVHSGRMSIVYEAGTGVFTPGHGADTKQLLYEDLADDVVRTFDEVRSRVLPEAPERVRRGCHLQGNEFNVTLKPNDETGSERAVEIIERALCHLLDLVGDVVAAAGSASAWARAYYAASDPEIRGVLERRGEMPDVDRGDLPEAAERVFDRIEVAYYEGDAAEIASKDLNKPVGVEAAFEVLGIDDPFALVMGDSKSDLDVMEWIESTDAGVAAAPEHASTQVLEHVLARDELVFDAGAADEMLRTVYALNRIAGVA